jgi:ribosomal protein S27AE
VEQETLYEECPLCNEGQVVAADGALYRCDQCDLTIKKRSLLGILRKNQFGIESLGQGNYSLAGQGLDKISLPPEQLKVVIGNIYDDQQLASIAGGSLEIVRPVRTILAEIILEQLKEICHIQVNGVRRAHGQPLPEGSSYRPEQGVPRQELEWQDQGNLFVTSKHLVLPSDSFTFLRLDRKLTGVRAFLDGVAVQRKGEDFATYFIDCPPHEAALVAAFVMGKLPVFQKSGQPVADS